MKKMKKKLINKMDELMKVILKNNANSTTSVIMFQPQIPSELKKLSNIDKK